MFRSNLSNTKALKNVILLHFLNMPFSILVAAGAHESSKDYVKCYMYKHLRRYHHHICGSKP